MRVSAILVLGTRSASFPSADDGSRADGRPSVRTPLACLDVLGQSVLERTVIRLHRAGIKTISLVKMRGVGSLPRKYRVDIANASSSSDRWAAAERVLTKHAAQGMDTAIVMEVGAYAEIDLVDALRFHRSKREVMTQFRDHQGSLKSWIVDISSLRNSSRDFMAPFSDDGGIASCAPYSINAYVNRLNDARDLRRLVTDALLRRCEFEPRGREIKPGVWMDEGARVHPSARIVAPAYLGSSTRVGPSAVITRVSNLERNVRVGGGTIVDASSILPYTSLGKCLEVSHAIVDRKEFMAMRRNLSIRIEDPKLMRDTSPYAWPAPNRQLDFEPRPVDSLDLAYSQYLTRAAGRLSGVFKVEL